MTRKLSALPSQQELHKLFTYNATTGVFVWRNSQGTAKAGTEAGWLHSSGYVYIGVHGRNYKAHRLAWVYVHGTAPNGLLDHKNRDKTDNRICNLRLVTDGQNNQNKKVYKNNGTGHKGVGWYAPRKLWRARIQHDSRVFLVGYYPTLEQAVAARRIAEQRLHTHAATA